MIKIVVFDLDGTLLDTLGNIAGNLNATLSACGYTPFPTERYRYFVGDGAKVLVERALCAQDAYTPEAHTLVYERFMTVYRVSPNEGTYPYDGIRELLSALKARGILAAVCTNKPQEAAEKSVAHFFGEDLICAVCGAHEGVPLKPSPDSVFAILDRFDIRPEEAAFVGDSDVDMKTGKAAGTLALGATWGFRTPEELTAAGADALLSAPKDLLTHIF